MKRVRNFILNYALFLLSGVFAIFVSLVVISQGAGSKKHISYLEQLNHLEASNERYNTILLYSRLDLLNNFDELLSAERSIFTLLDSVEQSSSALNSANQRQLVKKIGYLSSLLRKKQEYVSSFKTARALYTNSAIYLPLVNAEIEHVSMDKNEGITAEVHRIGSEVITFLSRVDDRAPTLLQQQVGELEKEVAEHLEWGEGDITIEANVLRHCRLILDSLGGLNRYTQKSLSVEIAEGIVDLRRIYLAGYHERQELTTLGNRLLILFTLALYLLLFRYVMNQRNAYQALEKSYGRVTDDYISIVDAAPAGIGMVDANGTIVVANPALLHIFGYKKSELLGKPLEDLLPSGLPVPYSECYDYLDQRGGRFLLGGEMGHIELHNKLGNSLTISMELKRASMDGEPCVLLNAVDVTERYRLELAKDEFLASMSHELRTPLTAIIGNSELLSSKEKSSEKIELIRTIEMAGRGQLALVNDILDMSKIESGKFTINDAPYDLARLLQHVEYILSYRAKEVGLTWELEQTNHESYQLLGDVQRIIQILINLVGNAIKFTPKGEVSLVTWVSGELLFFEVKDTGVGMSPETMKKLFQRFEQGDEAVASRFGGSGLGLFISENLAGLMGGQIQVSSEVDAGSTFTLSIPYRRSDTLVDDVEEEVQSAPTTPLQFHGKVLIAEDTHMLQVLECRLLEELGLTVVTANNGAEAVEWAQQDHFDLILMDMQMPVMDGIEATRVLREGGYEAPVVALTANVMKKHRDAFEAAGCDGFLAKPFEKHELEGMLSEYLRVDEKG